MAHIGEELKQERERKGISLRDMADATKINIRFLKALEEGQLDMLPGKFFTRGIIRSYAQYLGLDADTVLDKFLDSSQRAEPELEGQAEEEAHKITPGTGKKIVPYSVIAVLLTIVLVVIFTFMQRAGNQKAEDIVPQKEILLQEEVPPPVLEPFLERKELRLDIVFHEKTWIQIYADGEIQLNTEKLPGERFQVTARESLVLTTGNAGGFTFTLNGLKGRVLGGTGVVLKDTRITLENYKDFLEKEPDG